MRTVLVLGVAAGLALCASPGAAQAPDGQALYQQHCRTCHGLTGTPPAQMLRIYTTLAPFDSAFLAGRSQDSVVVVLRDGIGQMKGYKAKLTPEQMAAVATYVRGFAPRRPPTAVAP